MVAVFFLVLDARRLVSCLGDSKVARRPTKVLRFFGPDMAAVDGRRVRARLAVVMNARAARGGDSRGVVVILFSTNKQRGPLLPAARQARFRWTCV